MSLSEEPHLVKNGIDTLIRTICDERDVDEAIFKKFRPIIRKLLDEISDDHPDDLAPMIAEEFIARFQEAVDGFDAKTDDDRKAVALIREYSDKYARVFRINTIAPDRDYYRILLGHHGLNCWNELYELGPTAFRTLEFGDYKTGHRFAGAVLGRVLGRTVDFPILREIADTLGLPEITEKRRDYFKRMLAEHHIYSRNGLRLFSTDRFAGFDFEGLGKGIRFASAVLTKPVGSKIRYSELDEIADMLQLEEFSEAQRAYYRCILEVHGIHSRQDLIKKGVSWFRTTQFDQIGKGRRLARAILGNPQGYEVTMPVLHMISREIRL